MAAVAIVLLFFSMLAFLWLGTKPSYVAIEILGNHITAIRAKYLPKRASDQTLSWPIGEDEKVLLECNCICSVPGPAGQPDHAASSSTGRSSTCSGMAGRVRLVQKKSGDGKISIIVRESNKTGRILLSLKMPTRISRMKSQSDRTVLDATKFVLTFDNSGVVAEKFKGGFERAQGLDVGKGLDLWEEREWMDLMVKHSTIPLEVIGANAIYRGWNVDDQSELRKTVSSLTTKVNTLRTKKLASRTKCGHSTTRILLSRTG